MNYNRVRFLITTYDLFYLEVSSLVVSIQSITN
uniref:Uncharacterized protein n=1 Tax=Virus sp. cts3e7 TaxID=2825802 RepID=A0A8S5RNE4_9VIRU|nr:MAG TPA: hypothetical protein [Virus sp. cts3e7]